MAGRVNYLAGTDPHLWRTDIPTYSAVRASHMYRGIDVVYRGTPQAIEYDFLLAPKANPNQIRLRAAGAPYRIASDGSLLITVGKETLREEKPIAYQEWRGLRRFVDARYHRFADGTVGIRLGPYDRSRPLVIDLTIVYSGALGNQFQEGDAAAIDSTGAAYIAGSSAPGFDSAFVAKLAPDGRSLVYLTYLQGNFKATGIAVDASGTAYVVANSYDGNHAGLAEGVVVFKISPDGKAILYKTSLPGPSLGHGIALDSQGNAYITGQTRPSKFPVTAGAPQKILHGEANIQLPTCRPGITH